MQRSQATLPDPILLLPGCWCAPQAKGVQLLLPTDVVVADKFDANANTQTVPITAIPDGWMGLDIGPDSVKTFNVSVFGMEGGLERGSSLRRFGMQGVGSRVRGRRCGRWAMCRAGDAGAQQVLAGDRLGWGTYSVLQSLATLAGTMPVYGAAAPSQTCH